MKKANCRFRNLSPDFDKKPAPPGKSCDNIRPIEVVLMARLSRKDGRRSPRPEARVRCVRADSSWNPPSSKLRQNLSAGNVMRMSNRLALVFCVVLCLGVFSQAQTDVNDVHVMPR